MTFQQLEYIVAVDKYRHFVKAATACGVTQSTLSSLIQKLEQEIDVVIFDRKKHPIEPTVLGKQIIAQARLILHTSSHLRELVLSEKEQEHASLFLGLPPSLASVIYPTFHRLISAEHPGIHTSLFECPPERLLQMLKQGEVDMVFSTVPELDRSSLMDIELFTERFDLYISSAHGLYQRERVNPEDLMDSEMWTLRSFHENYPQLSDIIHRDTIHRTTLETGTLQTLVGLIDENGGYTILPQLFASHLTAEQQRNIRPINGGKFFRPVSLIIRDDYLRERMLNIVADLIKRIVPDEMINARLKKFKITL